MNALFLHRLQWMLPVPASSDGVWPLGPTIAGDAGGSPYQVGAAGAMDTDGGQGTKLSCAELLAGRS